MPVKTKNYRLGDTSLEHVQACMDDLGLTTSVMAIRVAIEHLYASREDLNVTKYLVALRKYDTNDTNDTDTSDT